MKRMISIMLLISGCALSECYMAKAGRFGRKSQRPAAQQELSSKEEAKPVETKAAEAKPTETKQAEAKPVEAKQAVTKPAQARQAETKPVESKTQSSVTTKVAALSLQERLRQQLAAAKKS